MSATSKKIIPIRTLDNNRYAVERLLADGSLVATESERRLAAEALQNEPEITRLLHPEVRYEVTDHCNASCIMCPRDKHEHGREHGIMDQAKYEKSIDEVVGLGAKKIVLTGFGEPMLDKRLEDKVAYASGKGLSTYFITNGSALTPKRSRRLMEAGLAEMRVSFYGMRPETYNAVMQGLDFDRTMKGLLEFLKIRDESGSKTRVQISYLELEQNRTDTEAFREFWEPKVNAIEIWKPHNFGDGRDYRFREGDLERKTSCGRPENGPFQIQWNGEVIPCCYDYNNQIILGNAFEQPVLEILNNEKYRLLRYAHRMKKFGMFPYCDQCDQLLPHADALVYTNRHNLPAEEAVKLSNTDLFDLVAGKEIAEEQLSSRYIGANKT
ncbi:MAG: radical SAM/SPASM domain-containing protein [Betaproteobacteria bacterium]|jgi:MoaA/NifB/PqqE/SkfB family radical SAM enzyme|nr:SPASM domain-containing protein [Betaproteobacteria bacterium]